MAFRTYEQEIALIIEIHNILEQRVKRYMEIIDSFKDHKPENYFAYYMEMCNFFKQYDHDSTFCRECYSLQTKGSKALGYIQKYYCKEMRI